MCGRKKGRWSGHEKGNWKWKKVTERFNSPCGLTWLSQKSQGRVWGEASPLVVQNWLLPPVFCWPKQGIRPADLEWGNGLHFFTVRNCKTYCSGHVNRKEWRAGATCVPYLPHIPTKTWDVQLYNILSKASFPYSWNTK